VFERFTEEARQVVVLAQHEARELGHNYIGTEHLLLGLLRQEQELGAHVLDSLELTLEDVRTQVARIVGRGDAVASGQIPFTPRAKKVLELSLRESLALGHNYIGTEHLLLGLVRENQGVAARILVEFRVTARDVAGSVIQRLTPTAGAPEYVRGFSAEPAHVFGEDVPAPLSTTASESALARSLTKPVFLGWAVPMIVGATLLGLGVLIGWLIWA
jgi:ATP-dependent Clp protease ATP-binding subunit ClpC